MKENFYNKECYTSTKLEPIQTYLNQLLFSGFESKGESSDNEIEFEEPQYVDEINIKDLQRGKIYTFWLHVSNSSTSEKISVPVVN
jgi:hypothetical protein